MRRAVLDRVQAFQDVPPEIVSACSVVSRSESIRAPVIRAGVVRRDLLGVSWRQGVTACRRGACSGLLWFYADILYIVHYTILYYI